MKNRFDFRVVSFALLFITSAVMADAPRVVSARPDNGDRDVDPALAEMRIEFDQPMSRSGYSICGGGPAFPELAGKPRWLTAKVLVVPMKLKPDHEYQLSINCPAAQNCRGANGEPAEPYPISFHTRAAGASAKPRLKAAVNRKAIDALRRAIEENYSYRDLHHVDWNKQLDQARPQLQRAKTPAEFARAAARLLSVNKDIHITVRAGDSVFPTHRRSVPANCNFDLLSQRVPNWEKRSDCVWTGRYDDGVGYIFISTWGPREPGMLDPVDDAIDALADAKGIVLDVRANSGGDELLARRVAGRFVERPRVYSKSVFRRKDAPDGFTKPQDRMIEPRSDKPRFKGKVAVLMGAHNMSSCESFLFMMKQSPRCRLFGEKSYGSSGNPRPHDLGNGVTVLLPSWKDLAPDGTLVEGVGIAPDETVTANAEDFSKSDPVLDKALEWIRQ